MTRSLEMYADVVLGIRTHLLIRQSAWITQEVFLQIIDILIDRLEPYIALFKFVLVFDCVRCHLSVDVCNKLLAAGIRVVVIPAKLTWLFQPLDTHVFATFKGRLKKGLQRVAMTKSNGVVSDREWIQVVAECINDLATTNHQHAFLSNGMMGHQRSMKAVNKLKIFSQSFVDSVGRGQPSYDEIKFALGIRSVPWYEHVMIALQEEEQIRQGMYSQGSRPSISYNPRCDLTAASSSSIGART